MIRAKTRSFTLNQIPDTQEAPTGASSSAIHRTVTPLLCPHLVSPTMRNLLPSYLQPDKLGSLFFSTRLLWRQKITNVSLLDWCCLSALLHLAEVIARSWKVMCVRVPLIRGQELTPTRQSGLQTRRAHLGWLSPASIWQANNPTNRSVWHQVERRGHRQGLNKFNSASLWLLLVFRTLTCAARGEGDFVARRFLVDRFNPNSVALGAFVLKLQL